MLSDVDEERQGDTQELQLLLDSLLDAPELNNVSAEEVYENSCEECAQKQQEELDVLAAVYGDDFNLLPSQQGADTMVDIKIRNLFFGQDSHSFVFSVNIPATYPNTPPFFDLHTLTGFKRDQIDRLWGSIISIGENKIGQPMLYDMTSYCQEFMANLQTQSEKEMTVPQAATPKQEEVSSKGEEEVEEEAEESGEKRVFIGLEVRSHFGRSSDLFHALRLFDQSPYRVVRVENIRNVHREKVFAAKCRTHNNQVPIWVWHGTNFKNIPRIIARGLLPGGSAGVRMEHGNSYGSGIYLAKNPTVSLGYTNGAGREVTRLLLCSLLPVVRVYSEYEWGYVCRDGELILPSYTVDVIRDPECTRTNNLLQPTVAPLRQLMEVDFSDVKGQEKVDKMTAYASRHLPYGFGSASGDAFQVLEVAPHDDDDDDTSYAEYVYQEEHHYAIGSEYSTETKMTNVDYLTKKNIEEQQILKSKNQKKNKK